MGGAQLFRGHQNLFALGATQLPHESQRDQLPARAERDSTVSSEHRRPAGPRIPPKAKGWPRRAGSVADTPLPGRTTVPVPLRAATSAGAVGDSRRLAEPEAKAKACSGEGSFSGIERPLILLDWHKTITFEDRRSGEHYIRSREIQAGSSALPSPVGYDLGVSAPSLTGCITSKAEEICRVGACVILCVVDDQRVLLQAVEQLQANRLLGNRCRVLISHANRPSAALEELGIENLVEEESAADFGLPIWGEVGRHHLTSLGILECLVQSSSKCLGRIVQLGVQFTAKQEQEHFFH